MTVNLTFQTTLYELEYRIGPSRVSEHELASGGLGQCLDGLTWVAAGPMKRLANFLPRHTAGAQPSLLAHR
jgi:hypothetical protein